MKKGIAAFSILLFITTHIFGQQTFRGIVTDSETKEPVAFAAVKFLDSSKDSVIFTVYSNDKGMYILPYLTDVEPKITAEMLGYKKFEVEFKELNPHGYNYDITIVPNIELLEEIEISATASKIVRKLDRTVVNVSKEQIKSSQNIYDILKTLPGVFVDEGTNTIRFKGSNPDILVNNLNAEFIYPDLRIIDINQVEGIELIDKSSIYGGAGEGGIINIKTKKMKTQQNGFGAYLGSDNDYGITNNVFVPKYELLNLNFNSGKIMIINNLGLSTDYTETKAEGTGNLKINGTNYNRVFESNKKSRQTYIADALGIIIPLRKGQLLCVNQFQYSPYNMKMDLEQNTYPDTTFYNEISQKNKEKATILTNQFAIQLNFDNFYKQDIKLSFFNLNGFSKPERSNTDYFSKTFQNNITYSDTVFYEQQTKINKHAINVGELQYKYNISQSSHLGLFGRFIRTLNFDTRTFWINEIEYPQFNEENKDAKVLNFDGGLSYAKRINRFAIDLTAGYNFQQIAGDFTRYDTTINLNLKYHNFEPSIRFKYLVNVANDLSLGYSYSANRFKINNPIQNIRVYIPYIDKTNPTNWKSGNSNLELEKYHKIYFQYKYTKESINFSTELFYSLTNNGVTNILIPIDTETILTQPENMAFNDRIGTDLNLWYQVSKQWAFSIGAQLYHSRFKSNALDIISEIYEISAKKINQKSFGANAQTSIRYNLKSKIGTNPNIRFWLDFNSREITFTGYDEQYVNANIAFRSNFFKNKLYTSLGLMNFLSPFIHKQTIYDYLDVATQTHYYSYFDNMRISLSLGLNLFAGDRGTKDFKL
jgi:hypothetical protein